MLGEPVDQGFEIENAASIKPGQVLGWIEGFKAVSDVFGVMDGKFVAENPALKDQLDLVHRDPHGEGWLYEATGTPDTVCVDVVGYVEHLNRTIDRMLDQQKNDPEN